MLGKNNHVGKSNNIKMKKRKINKIHIIVASIILVIIIVVLITTGSLSNLMGNSVANQFYCEDSSYKLDGDKCVKEIKTKAAVLGDVNLDEKIDEQDVKLITDYIDYIFYEEGENNLSDFQIKLADINQDGEVYYVDETILKEYLDGTISTYGIYQENIGVSRFCEGGYTLQDNYCVKQDVKTAKKKIAEIKSNNEANENKSNDNNTTNEFTIEFDGNSGKNSMSSQKITYGVETAINKNRFVITHMRYNEFLYWKVYNKTSKKWLCYNKNYDEQYLTKEECEDINNGYVRINDGQIVSTIANPGETIVLYAQWGLTYINYSYQDKGVPYKFQKVSYGQNVKLEKNSFIKDDYDFIGWRVANDEGMKEKQKYLCYIDNKKSNSRYMSDDDCKKYGYVILPDEAQVKIGKDILYDNILYAQWERKKEKINDDLSISISDNLDSTSQFYGSSISGYEITDSKFKKVVINAKIQVEKPEKYYYKWLTYKNSSLNYQSNCLKIKSGDEVKDLDLTLGRRKGIFVIYSDSNCKNVIKKIETSSYFNRNYEGEALGIKKGLLKKAVIETKNGVENRTNINQSNQYYPYNSTLYFEINTNIIQPLNEYSYTWGIVQGKSYTPGKCYKLPKSGKINVNFKIASENVFENYGYSQRKLVIYDNDYCGSDGTDLAEWRTPKYKLQYFNVKYDANGGKGANSQRKIIYNNNDKNMYADYVHRDGYDFVGYKVKNSKGQYICYKNSAKTSKNFTSDGDCKKYGYVLYRKTDKLSRTTSINNETLTFIAQWSNNPVTVNISKLGKTKLSKGTKVTNTITFKVNDTNNNYYYKWGYLKLNSNLNYSDSSFINNFDQYSTINKYDSYDGSPINIKSGDDWDLGNQKCRKINASTYFRPTLTIERKYNVGIILVYKDSSCSNLINSEKKVHKLTEIYRCNNCN